MQYYNVIGLVMNPLKHFSDYKKQSVQWDNVLGEGIVEYLSEQGGDLARAKIKEDVVVWELAIKKLSNLDVVGVIRVAHAVLVNGRSEVNLASNLVEAV